MSVINKVLRDLDSRSQPTADAAQAGAAPLTRGTSSVGAMAPVAPRRAGLWWLVWLAVAVLLTGGGLWWWQGRSVPLPSAPVQASVLPPAAQPVAVASRAEPATVPGSGPVPVQGANSAGAAATLLAPASAPAPVPVPAAPGAPVPAFSMLLPAPLAPPAKSALAGATPPQAHASGPSDGVMRVAPVGPAADLPRATARTEAAPAAGAVAPAAWPELALEALAQAQRTWNAGARDAAIDFLADALAGVERAHAQEWGGGGALAQAPMAMVRELARMATVQGQPATVLELLRRHERLVAQQADLWALRGSAAQRLSQHADASQSYLMALKLRPGEQRWMLGAAVSLAAQGQTAPAAEWAEQARAAGPVSPEVLAYLRQLGVNLRER